MAQRGRKQQNSARETPMVCLIEQLHSELPCKRVLWRLPHPHEGVRVHVCMCVDSLTARGNQGYMAVSTAGVGQGRSPNVA